jgi:hypothetical protein
VTIRFARALKTVMPPDPVAGRWRNTLGRAANGAAMDGTREFDSTPDDDLAILFVEHIAESRRPESKSSQRRHRELVQANGSSSN